MSGRLQIAKKKSLFEGKLEPVGHDESKKILIQSSAGQGDPSKARHGQAIEGRI